MNPELTARSFRRPCSGQRTIAGYSLLTSTRAQKRQPWPSSTVTTTGRQWLKPYASARWPSHRPWRAVVVGSGISLFAPPVLSPTWPLTLASSVPRGRKALRKNHTNEHVSTCRSCASDRLAPAHRHQSDPHSSHGDRARTSPAVSARAALSCYRASSVGPRAVGSAAGLRAAGRKAAAEGQTTAHRSRPALSAWHSKFPPRLGLRRIRLLPTETCARRC
jgi:hypothetical protein